MVLAGSYEEAVKMMGDMNFLQVGRARFLVDENGVRHGPR